MKIQQALTKTLTTSLVLVGAGCAGVLAFSTPTRAATLAFAESFLEFSNFSVQPLETGTFADTNTLTIAFDGSVVAESRAISAFPTLPSGPASASSFVSSLTTGQGTDYLGIAEGSTSLVGRFNVNRGDVFSFDFRGSIELASAIDRPLFEQASALSGINFSLSAIKSNGSSGKVFDSFSALAVLNTPGQDFYDYGSTGHVSLKQLSVEKTPNGVQETLVATFMGTYRRVFKGEKPVNLQLSQGKFGAATVSSSPKPIPEPLTIFGSILAVGVGGWLRKQYLLDK